MYRSTISCFSPAGKHRWFCIFQYQKKSNANKDAKSTRKSKKSSQGINCLKRTKQRLGNVHSKQISKENSARRRLRCTLFLQPTSFHTFGISLQLPLLSTSLLSGKVHFSLQKRKSKTSTQINKPQSKTYKGPNSGCGDVGYLFFLTNPSHFSRTPSLPAHAFVLGAVNVALLETVLLQIHATIYNENNCLDYLNLQKLAPSSLSKRERRLRRNLIRNRRAVRFIRYSGLARHKRGRYLGACVFAEPHCDPICKEVGKPKH